MTNLGHSSDSAADRVYGPQFRQSIFDSFPLPIDDIGTSDFLKLDQTASCFSPAEIQIEVKVGLGGSISLSLCNDCVRKFSDENETH